MDEAPVGVDVLAEGERIAHDPAIGLQQVAVRFVHLRERHLEALLRSLGKIDELEKLVVLAPRVQLAGKIDVADDLAPVRDGPEVRTRRSRTIPQVEQHRLASGPEVE